MQLEPSEDLAVHVVPVTPFQQNASLLACRRTGRLALVDPGGDPALLRGQVEALGGEVEKILVTHGHLDHAGATAEDKAVTIVSPRSAGGRRVIISCRKRFHRMKGCHRNR